jgi:hypothetical protein
MICNYLQGLSNQTWEELGSPTAPTASYIFSWFVSKAGVGKLNNATNNCFAIVSGNLTPEPKNEELAIYKELYKISYYDLKVAQATNSALSDSWLELKDDVSTIKRHNKNEVAKTLVGLRKEVSDSLKDMIFQYQQNNSASQFVNMGNNNEINPYSNTDFYDGGFNRSRL